MAEKVKCELKEGVTLVGDYYDSPSKKGIILFPGFTEHRSSLEDTAKYLNLDFKTWTFDINSQGESSGNWDLKQMTRSACELVNQLKKKYHLSKVGAMGNSLGGMIVGLNATKTNSNLDSICLISTPSGLQDPVPKQVQLLKYFSQSIVRLGTIAFDKIELVRNNKKYKNKSHSQFFQEGEYKPYAQLGAIKIKNIQDTLNWVNESPRLDSVAKYISQPTLIIYGGEDKLLGIKNGVLPEKIEIMRNNFNNKNTKLIIVPGADHGLNIPNCSENGVLNILKLIDNMDKCFNSDGKYQFVKTEIYNHFANSLL